MAIVPLEGLGQLKNRFSFSTAQPNSAKVQKTGQQRLVAPHLNKTRKNKPLQWKILTRK
jgi:hypothetical protein